MKKTKTKRKKTKHKNVDFKSNVNVKAMTFVQHQKSYVSIN